MTVYDDKTIEAKSLDEKNVLIDNISGDNIVFKSSFIIIGNISATGKITALFDLFIFGDLLADDLEVKGRFVCTGNCYINNSVFVQKDVWVDTLIAKTVDCQDRTVVIRMNAEDLCAAGNIVVGTTLVIEKEANCSGLLLCGETLFGSGTVRAKAVMTGDPIDLDDGESAVFIYQSNNSSVVPDKNVNTINELINKYQKSNNYNDFLNEVMKFDDENSKKAATLLFDIEQINMFLSNINDMKPDIRFLLLAAEIKASKWFKEWEEIKKSSNEIINFFTMLSEGKNPYKSKNVLVSVFHEEDRVNHITEGTGTVKAFEESSLGKVVVIEFDSGVKRNYVIKYAKDKFFTLDANNSLLPEDLKSSICCNLESYSEWLNCLCLVDKYESLIKEDLVEIVKDLLMSNLGLKNKFFEDRIKENGWG